MRVTAKTKEKTRRWIMKVACDLFQSKGFSQTTTRDIAKAAGIATGTMFNYFPTKEELGLAILGSCLKDAEAEFQGRRRGDETLDELLFALIATNLRHLRPHRLYVAEVLNSGLRPYVKSPLAGEGERIRTAPLETVQALVFRPDENSYRRASGARAELSEPSAVALHIYWTLFLGVLGFWAADESPHQEDTLALLDQSMKLFVNSLANEPGQPTETTDGPTAG